MGTSRCTSGRSRISRSEDTIKCFATSCGDGRRCGCGVEAEARTEACVTDDVDCCRDDVGPIGGSVDEGDGAKPAEVHEDDDAVLPRRLPPGTGVAG
jgi:hypothetical protein